MKLQKLIIHNIASIEDAVIDFEAQPLAGSEVFLITGKSVWHSLPTLQDWRTRRCKEKPRMWIVNWN